MQRFIGVDPGSVMTGAAVMLDSDFVFWLESADPCAIWEVIWCNAAETRDLQIILEDFLGSGPRDKHIKRTIEVLGYIYHSCREHGLNVVRVPQHKRLSCVKFVPEYIRGKDERAAAAHVLAYRERNGLESFTNRGRAHR